MRWSELPSRSNLSYSSWALSVFLLALPTIILGLLASRTGSLPVAVGAGVEGLFLLVFVRVHPVWRPPVSISVVVLYLIALAWAWLPLRGTTDWAPHVAQGVLLLVAMVLLAAHDLTRTGAEPLRRANKWTGRIKARRHWPEQLADCRVLPDAVGLRVAIREEAGPALALLSDERPTVQAAALGALEHRPYWRPGEGEFVFRFAQSSEEPAVRVAAIHALAGVSTPELVAGLASFLRDQAPEVRLAAAEALMWEADTRWPFARDGVREAMADQRLAGEGATFVGIGRLPAAAIADLTTWSSEHPPLAHRAILTLIEHYHTDLMAAERPELGSELAALMLNPETSPALRVELAALLRDHHLLSSDLLDRLTNLDQPGPMRLFAAELMLRINPHDPDGVDVLRGLARQPNREMAMQVAVVLQNVLGLQLGLTEGELPLPNSKQAADTARRVLAWANGADPDDIMRPTPGPRAGLKGASRHSLPAMGSRGSIPNLPPVPTPGMSAAQVNVTEPMDESAMLPMTEPAVPPMDESGMLPRTEIVKPPPLPKRPPQPGSSAVI
jgi:hypothetical protein